MLDIYYDCETTGINPYCAEIIDAYFEVHENNKIVDSYVLQSQVNFWSDEAAIYHKIQYAEMKTYPKKKIAFRELLKWLPKDFKFLTYVNLNSELGRINFDVAILENELNLLGCKNYHLKNKYGMLPPESIHTLARQSATNKIFSPIRGESGRASLSQPNVYKALFGESYDAHKSIDDVKALVRIHKQLLHLNNENRTIFNWC